jgi:3-carboxy-cis,cis-muconate cycloisomerase
MLGGLIVDEARMRWNLDMTHGLIVAEAVMMGLAPHLGRNEAHDVVYDACRAVAELGGSLAEALARVPAVSQHFDRTALERLTDPANYLGAAQEMVDRVIATRA